MPKRLHRRLRKSARRRGLTGERADAYVYGTLAKIKKRKGRARG